MMDDDLYGLELEYKRGLFTSYIVRLARILRFIAKLLEVGIGELTSSRRSRRIYRASKR